MNAKLSSTITIVVALIIFSTTVFSQTQEKVLTQAETEAVVELAARAVLEVTGDESVLDAVTERWEAQEIEGMTRSQIMRLLFADVQAVIQDPAMRTAIWKAWHPPAAVTTTPKTAATPVPARPPVEEEDEVPTPSKPVASPQPKTGNTQISREQMAALEQLKRHIQAESDKNIETWRGLFSMMSLETGLDRAPEYDPFELAGMIYIAQGTPDQAFMYSMQGLYAYRKIYPKENRSQDGNWIAALTLFTVACDRATDAADCGRVREVIRKKGEDLLVRILKRMSFFKLLMDPKNQETLLKNAFVGVHQHYQAMEFYDPYKIEADCRKNGGDEYECIKSTYFGMAPYALFGKQADEKVKVDKKSIDLINRWRKERLRNIVCADKDCTQIKPRE